MNPKKQIESLLFISHKPLSLSEISKLVSLDKKETEKIILGLMEEYKQRNGGMVIIQIEDKFQMATSGDTSELISKFVKSEMTGELTKPSLEALTVIAYRGPISKAELELIRGVNCSLILRNLLMRGLIEAKEDKAKGVTIYQITFDFLKFLGLSSQKDLPDFEKLNQNNNLDKLLSSVKNEII
ncbi:MAG: SMC-Scp complex subunit ScpB [Patescibacteria group bacterium]